MRFPIVCLVPFSWHTVSAPPFNERGSDGKVLNIRYKGVRGPFGEVQNWPKHIRKYTKIELGAFKFTSYVGLDIYLYFGKALKAESH